MKRIALVEVDIDQSWLDEIGGDDTEGAWNDIKDDYLCHAAPYEPYSIRFLEWKTSVPVGTNSVVEAAYCTHRVKVGNMLVRCDECRKKGLM